MRGAVTAFQAYFEYADPRGAVCIFTHPTTYFKIRTSFFQASFKKCEVLDGWKQNECADGFYMLATKCCFGETLVNLVLLL